MEFLQLQYFLELAKHQHVSRTAALLHISQPALSATINKLEKELGVELFLRKGRNIALSPYGEVFKEYVEEAMSLLKNGKQAVMQMKNTDNLTLNLGILSPYIWYDVTESFRDAHPDIQIDIYSMEENNFFEKLISGEIDFYLGSINQIEKTVASKIQYVTLYEDDMVVLMNKSHPLAKKKNINLAECKDENFINLNPNTSLQQFIDHLWEKAGISPKAIMTCDYTMRDLMVSKNYGVSITTMRAAQKCNFSEVTFCKIQNLKEKRKLGLVWRRTNKPFSIPMQSFYDIATGIYHVGSN